MCLLYLKQYKVQLHLFYQKFIIFPLSCTSLETILHGNVKHLTVLCKTSSSSSLVPSARLPLFVWSSCQQRWRRDPPEIQPQPPLPLKPVFSCQISSPKWFTDWLYEQLCQPKREADTGSEMMTVELHFTYFLNQSYVFLICRPPVVCKLSSCSLGSLCSHFCDEQTKHQPTTEHFSACFIVYRNHVQQEIAHCFPQFSIGLLLSLIKYIIYLGN